MLRQIGHTRVWFNRVLYEIHSPSILNPAPYRCIAGSIWAPIVSTSVSWWPKTLHVLNKQSTRAKITVTLSFAPPLEQILPNEAPLLALAALTVIPMAEGMSE